MALYIGDTTTMLSNTIYFLVLLVRERYHPLALRVHSGKSPVHIYAVLLTRVLNLKYPTDGGVESCRLKDSYSEISQSGS